MVPSSGIAKLPKPRSIDELEKVVDNDSLADCCPWLDLTQCKCNCTNFPALGNVLVCSETTVPAINTSYDSDEFDEDEDVNFSENEFVVVDDEEEESDKGEKSDTFYKEYVALRGSSFHEDCQATLEKCRELLGAKKSVELRVLPEPENMRDKVPKFTVAIRKNELQDVRFKNIRCQYVMSDKPTWTFMASVLAIKSGKWLSNDGKYRYNDSI